MKAIARRKVLFVATGILPLLTGHWLISQSETNSDTTSSMPSLQSAGLKLMRDTSYALGTNISVTVVHEDDRVAKAAISSALSEVHLIDRLMSIYRPDSQVSQLNRSGSLDAPHPYSIEVLAQTQMFSRLSEGAFDITVQPLWQVYARAQEKGQLPNSEAIALAQQKVNWRDLDISAKRIRFTKPGMAITLNGIAQGFAADRVLAVLKGYGIENALFDTGEIGCWGQKPSEQPWTVGVQNPRDPNACIGSIQPQNCFVATSGDYASTFSQDYQHHHIFDPTTGESPRELSSVTVLAPTGIEADGLSTAILVLGVEKGLALAKRIRGVEAIATCKDNRILATENFPLMAGKYQQQSTKSFLT
ncbi:FAD:protein FMN transferase [Pseudanabaena sp. PCC 6802]|uniref:FAD:protein FMN transferase n=1 Tax=Pseudanabaena sp. PCC 6802 TaxID=118173 RepID=UPI000349CA52|nr:FAD:protein FMN transferase [Pseudanabaena sp. PCC 6802]